VHDHLLDDEMVAHARKGHSRGEFRVHEMVPHTSPEKGAAQDATIKVDLGLNQRASQKQ
jgi:hypothetical protein